MATSVPVFASQSRAAGQYTSTVVNYNGGSADCTLTIQDVNWTTTTPISLIVTLEIQESFDNGDTWLVAAGPYNFSPPAVGKSGHAGCGFQAQNDGGGPRQVRALMTLNQTWTGGVQGSVN